MHLPARQRCSSGSWCASALLTAALLCASSVAVAQQTTAEQPATAPVKETTPQAPETEESEPVPASERRGAQRDCSSADVVRGLCTNAEAAAAAARKPWRVMARADLLMPLVFDQTPETEMQARYYLGAEIALANVVKGLYATAWLGFVHRFWRYQGTPNFDFEDAAVPLFALGYRHSVPVGAREMMLVHRFGTYVPLSRPSRDNLLYTKLDWATALRYPFEVKGLGAFMIGADIWTHYAFHQYLTQDSDSLSAGYVDPGGANTRWQIEAGGVLQYTIFDSRSAGSLMTQGALGYRHRLRYDASFEPDWYWAVGATYTPISYLSASLSVEHGYSDMLRGGAARLVAFDRDETLWRVSLFGRY